MSRDAATISMRLPNARSSAFAGVVGVAVVAIAIVGSVGCTGTAAPPGAYAGGPVADPMTSSGAQAGPTGGMVTTGAMGVGGGASGGGENTATTGSAGTVNLPDEPTAARVRRLTHVEYNNTVADLLGDRSAPADDFSADIAQNGFTNNAAALTVSPALVEQYMSASEQLSRAATVDLVALLGCDPMSAGEQACVEAFIADFGERAWRRPLSDAERTRLLGVFTTAREEFELDVAIQLVLQVVLQSPQFIYMLEPAPPGAAPGSVVPLDAWQLATRLSYFLLGSTPDSGLMAAAKAGELSTPEQVAAEARRLLTLGRARERIGLFFTEWLYLRNVDRMQKDPTLFPDYDLTLGPLLRQQVELFAQSVILDQQGSAVDLLTAPYSFISPELAPIYGVAPPADPGFTRVDLDPSRRAGLLTHAGLLASLAKADQTDPVHRGKFVRERLLCETVPPPPPNANITPPPITPGSTTRERFAQHQADPVCASCHALMDPIGLGFEHYDALGQWRDLDSGLPVVATGEIEGSDVAGTFDGALELVNKLAQSRQVMDCLAETWFRFALGRSIAEGDAAGLQALGDRFASSSFNIQELLVEVTQSRAFRYQLVPDPNTSAFEQEGQ